ncbi:MAG: hypothetical protein ACR2PQ_12960 [Myxococcota bacterium]
MSATVLGIVSAVIVVGAGVSWFRAVGRVQLPKDRRGYLAVWLLGGALGIAALTSGAGWVGGIPAGIAILGTAFFLLTVTISPQKAAPDVISVGAPIPEFSAPDDKGGTFESASLAGNPTLVKFFRGHW